MPAPKTGPQKAQVGALIAAVLAVVTALGAALPANNAVQVLCATIGSVLTAAATYVGVYRVTNKPLPSK